MQHEVGIAFVVYQYVTGTCFEMRNVFRCIRASDGHAAVASANMNDTVGLHGKE